MPIHCYSRLSNSRFIHFLSLFLFTSFFMSTTLYAKAPNMMLLKSYNNENINGWVMSEKLDGIRGYWDGKELYSKGGYLLHPPAYFIKNFPPFPIDGELFSQRGEFENISSIVRSTQQDKGWYKLKLHVFEVPNTHGNLFERLNRLKHYLVLHPSSYIQIIPQYPIQNKQQALDFLEGVKNNNGEGIVVRNPHAPAQTSLTTQVLKIKPVSQGTCKVISHNKGNKSFQNVLGSVTCQNDLGNFRIGSGFTLEERRHPPAIGSMINFQYRGLTKNRLPRFATFLSNATLIPKTQQTPPNN